MGSCPLVPRVVSPEIESVRVVVPEATSGEVAFTVVRESAASSKPVSPAFTRRTLRESPEREPV
jgi:hypothetical protein